MKTENKICKNCGLPKWNHFGRSYNPCINFVLAKVNNTIDKLSGCREVAKNESSGCGKEVDDGTNDNTFYICGKTKTTDCTGNSPKPEEIWLCDKCKESEEKLPKGCRKEIEPIGYYSPPIYCGDYINGELKLCEECKEQNKPIILDNNEISIRKYAEEYPENWEKLCKSINTKSAQDEPKEGYTNNCPNCGSMITWVCLGEPEGDFYKCEKCDGEFDKDLNDLNSAQDELPKK